jgi:SAM-dependent methyltransferase
MKTDNPEQLKSLVKEKYAEIAEQSKQFNATSCCGATGCGCDDNVVMADDYSKIDGYVEDADLGLGCGLPTVYSKIKEGDTVVDLGSGAGNDAFVARSLTGEKGKVIGIDFTEKMIEKARANSKKLDYRNVEFLQGDIESIPLPDNTADVVVSNCVLNLVPNKNQAFRETFRILKNGGHFSVSDIVIDGHLPEGLREAAELYAGCVSGAIQKDEYLNIVKASGFTDLTIQKEKEIRLPNEVLGKYLSVEEMKEFGRSKSPIVSITLYAVKR